MLKLYSSSRLCRGFVLIRLPQRLVHFTGDPQLVHQHREFSSDGHNRPLPGVLAAAYHQTQTPAAQVGVGSKMAQDVMSTSNQQTPQHVIAGLGNPQMGLALARVALSRQQSQVTGNIAALAEAMRVI